MKNKLRLASIECDSWELESAEARHKETPKTFGMPSRKNRENLRSCQAAKLLFRIESEDEKHNVHIEVERMWVIVIGREKEYYRGILSNNPASIEPDTFMLKEGTELLFLPEHIIDIDDPPEEFLMQKYGKQLGLK